MTRVASTARRLLAGLALLVCGYVAAGLVGGAVPANPGWRSPARGVLVFVESNGVHVGLVVPKVAARIDWRGTFPPRDLADPRYGGFDHLAIGWGEEGFYRGTPTWWDVRPRTVLAAAWGSDRTLLHVEHIARPTPGPQVRPVLLRPAEYRRLAAFIRASLAPRATAQHGYAAYDAFYQARGHYDAVRTCNAWTGEALRHAGVRVGRWTPFPVTVTGWF